MATTPQVGPDGPLMETTSKGNDYVVRPFEKRDTDGFLSLLSSEVGSSRDEEWFRGTYVENPYLDHVPLFVVEHDGDVVGARPFTAMRVRAGTRTTTGLLTRDTLVHPDHRRRGLFTAMTELAIDHYESEAPGFLFSHSNRNSRPGYRKMGWTYLRGRDTYSRLQNPADVVDARTRDAVTAVLSPASTLLSRAYLGVRDLTSTSPREISVTRHEDVPERTLAELYESRPPDGPHVVRDEAFYRWRFRSPEWQPNTAYVASRNGTPVAGVVTCTRDARFVSTSVVDVVPRTGGESWTDAIACILDRVVADNPSADVLRVPEPVFPTRILRERGFLSSRRLPLSALAIDRRRLLLGVRPLDGDATLDGHSLHDAARELWSVAH